MKNITLNFNQLSSWVFVCILLFLSYVIFSNFIDNFSSNNFNISFSFLTDSADFSIPQSLLNYKESDSYLKVYVIGLLNTLLIGFFGVILCSVIGFLIGIASLSKNILLRCFSKIYVEIFRNIPLLVQLFFWYFLYISLMPHIQKSYVFGDIYLNSRGLFLPTINFPDYFFSYIFIAITAIFIFFKLFHKLRVLKPWIQKIKWSVLFFFIFYAVFWLFADASISTPVIKGFKIVDGVRILPEFMALLTALSIYTAAFVAEVVRAGMNSVPKGQKEAGLSMGLSGGQIVRLIILPQAMFTMLPPLLSQYLNLIKNSSLAAFIGYPEIMSLFAGISLNQTGRAVEIMIMTLLTYLVINYIFTFIIQMYSQSISQKIKK